MRMLFQIILKSLGFVVGLLFAALGAMSLLVAVTGDFAQGRTGAYVAGYSCLAIAAPLLVLPFSSRVAGILTFLVLTVFAISMLWTAFGTSVAWPWPFRLAAIAFAALLLVRVRLAQRRLARI